MDATGKLVDVFVDWAKQGKRWALLLILLVPAYFAFFQHYYDVKFRQVFQIRAFLWLSVTTVVLSLCLFLLELDYEQIAYSEMMDRLHKGRRVMLTKPLAWHPLTYAKGAGSTGTVTVSVAKELVTMLRGLGMRLVVVPQPDGAATVPVTPRDQIIFNGDASPLGLTVRSVVVVNEVQSQDVVKRLMRGVIAREDSETLGSGGTVPLSRILSLQSLVGMYVCNLSIPSAVSAEQQTVIMRLFLSHALMVMLYRDGHGAAKRVARAMVDIGELLSPMENNRIAEMYRAAAFNLATQDGDLPEAVRALRVARKIAPSDSSIAAMLIVLHLKLKRIEEALQLLGEFEPATTDRGLYYWLKADYFMSSSQPGKAIAPFEEAIGLESDEENRAALHFKAAFAYAMADELPSRQQGDGMIRHLEDAINIRDNPAYHPLKAYGWALRGNLEQFEAECAKAAILIEPLPEQLRGNLRSFLENWKARGLRKLGQSSQIAENVLGVVGSVAESHDVQNLLVLAGAALDLAGMKGDPGHLAAAERYLDRVIELQPRNEEAFRYRGTIYTLRAQNSTEPEQKKQFAETARNDFLQSIRLGRDRPETHAVIAQLYETDGDPVNAVKHRERWLELAPDDPDAIAYHALAILDQTGDLTKAKAHLDGIAAKSKEAARVYRYIVARALSDGGEEASLPLLEVARECCVNAVALGDTEPGAYDLLAAILSQLAAMYQAANRLDEAANSYAERLKLDPTNYEANDNLAFLLFDRDKYEEALQHWEQAIKTSPKEADASAGKAAALHALGREGEAFSWYSTAVSLSRDFLDTSIMREKYSWSDKAIEAVKPFIERLSTQERGSSSTSA